MPSPKARGFPRIVVIEPFQCFLTWWVGSAYVFSGMFLALAMFHLDAAHSTAGFTIKHFLVGSTHGTMKIVSADVSLQPTRRASSVDAVIDVASVSTSEKGRGRRPAFRRVVRCRALSDHALREQRRRAGEIAERVPRDRHADHARHDQNVPLDVTVNDAAGASFTTWRRHVRSTRFWVDAPGRRCAAICSSARASRYG